MKSGHLCMSQLPRGLAGFGIGTRVPISTPCLSRFSVPDPLSAYATDAGQIETHTPRHHLNARHAQLVCRPAHAADTRTRARGARCESPFEFAIPTSEPKTSARPRIGRQGSENRLAAESSSVELISVKHRIPCLTHVPTHAAG
jgi:hypothetical protein